MDKFMEWVAIPQDGNGRVRKRSFPLRRSRSEIALDVLISLKQGGNLPTRMMYSANTSWRILTEIISLLSRERLLEKKDRCYYLTQKGFLAVARYEEAKDLLGNAAIPPTIYT
jgi:predicted transcriptional regulator